MARKGSKASSKSRIWKVAGWIFAAIFFLGGGQEVLRGDSGGVPMLLVGVALLVVMLAVSLKGSRNNDALFAEETNLKAAIAEKKAAPKALEEEARQVSSRKAEIEKAVSSMESNEKKALVLQKNIARLKTTYDSMKYAIEEFGSSSAFELAASGQIDLSSVAPVELQCLNMKELRARYRAVDKDIRDMYEQHRARFGEGDDPAIYNLMIMVLESERRNLLLTLVHGKLASALDAVALLISKLLTLTSGKTRAAMPP